MHAGNVPQCAQTIEELFTRRGLPDDVYTNVFIPSKHVDAIVSDRRVQGVSLTGGEAAGAAVVALAGKNFKRSMLELGGNDPFIVLEDADLKHAIEQAVKGRIVNAGQSCVAAKRFIVAESVADAFIAGFTKQMAALKMGDPMDEETTLSPLSTEDAAVNLFSFADVRPAVQTLSLIHNSNSPQ